MEDSPIGLDKWLTAMWQIVDCKNGISSYEVHRAIGEFTDGERFDIANRQIVDKRLTWNQLAGKHDCPADII